MRGWVRTILAVCAALASPGATGQTYLNELPLQEKSRYFDFRFRQNPTKIKEIARFADGFIAVVQSNFFEAKFEYPIQVLVLEDGPRFQSFLQRQFHIKDPPSFGVFLYQHNLFCTYEDSGLGTFSHEIMHPLVERNLKAAPIWAVEGIPTFFEKFYGYWEGEKLVVNWGYQNPWRISGLGTHLTSLDLKAILSTNETPGPYKESDRRLVSLFLWEHGKFRKFLHLIQTRDKHGYNSYFEAAMEMKIKDIVPRWQKYLDNVADRRPYIYQLPPSAVLPNEESFGAFTQKYRVRIGLPGQ